MRNIIQVDLHDVAKAANLAKYVNLMCSKLVAEPSEGTLYVVGV